MRVPDDNRDFSRVYGGAKSAEYLSKNNDFLCSCCRCFVPSENESIISGVCEECVEYFDDEEDETQLVAKSKYVINLDEIRTQMQEIKINKRRTAI